MKPPPHVVLAPPLRRQSAGDERRDDDATRPSWSIVNAEAALPMTLATSARPPVTLTALSARSTVTVLCSGR
jgi:hypothetical protein